MPQPSHKLKENGRHCFGSWVLLFSPTFEAVFVAIKGTLKM